MAQLKLYFSEIESAKEASNSHLHGLTEKLESNCQCVQGDLNKVKINTQVNHLKVQNLNSLRARKICMGFHHLLFLFKTNIIKNQELINTIRVSNKLDPNQVPHGSAVTQW